MFELVIVADENDGDYVTEISKITPQELERLIPLVEKVKDNFGAWPNGEQGDANEIYDWPEEDIEFFGRFVPYGQYGISGLESVEYYPLPVKVRLL